MAANSQAVYRRRRLVALAVALAFLALLIAVLLALVSGGDGDKEDIFLEAAASVGPDPFIPASAQVATTTTTVELFETTTTQVFGGSGQLSVCDKPRQIAYLRDHPDKAEAWVEALNSDPTFRWSGGGSLTVEDIPLYFDELTEAVLVRDTRVTNHGYKNGELVPRQSILQAGTAVLVDREGLPRVRCKCGNPLIPPKKVDNPNYVGQEWPGFGDQPPCAGKGCADTTTSTSSTSSTSSSTTIGRPTTTVQRPSTTVRRTTTTTRRQITIPPILTTVTAPPTTTTAPPTTTTTEPTTTTTEAPQ